MACGAVVAFGLWFLIEKTAFGVRLRATVDNAAMAEALGVRTQIVYAVELRHRHRACGVRRRGRRRVPADRALLCAALHGDVPGRRLGRRGRLDPRRAHRLPAARRRRHDRSLPHARIRQLLLLCRRHRYRLRFPARACSEGRSRCVSPRPPNRSRPCRRRRGQLGRDAIGVAAIVLLGVVGLLPVSRQSRAAYAHDRRSRCWSCRSISSPAIAASRRSAMPLCSAPAPMRPASPASTA